MKFLNKNKTKLIHISNIEDPALKEAIEDHNYKIMLLNK